MTEPLLRRLLLILLAGFLSAAPARAYDLELDTETIGQGYQIATGAGGIVTRGRLDQYLGLHVWNLGPKDALGVPTARNQVYFTMSMRFDTDFGNYPPPGNRIGATDVSSELANNRVELLYAYVGARDVAGLFDVKLGRQVNIDLFEFNSFDGLSVEVKTPYYLAAEVYGGLLVDGALPFDSAVFRPDGTAPSPLSLHDHDYKPQLGVNLRSFGFRDLDARFMFRQTWSPAQHNTLDEVKTHATDGTTEQKLGWSARGRLLDGMIVPWFGLRYNLLVGAVDIIEGGARFTLSPRHSLQAEYVYSYPTFDGDSIWNLFVRRQFDDVRVGYDLRLGRVRAYVRGFTRFFHDETEAVDRVSATNAAPNPGALSTRIDYGGNLGARVDLERGYVRLDGYGELGYGGTRIGVDLAARLRIYRDLLAAEGRLTFAHVIDDLRPIDSVDSFGFQVGARLQPAHGVLIHLLLEDNINKFYSSQLRFFAILDLAYLLGQKGFYPGQPPGIGPGAGQFGNPLGTGMGY